MQALPYAAPARTDRPPRRFHPGSLLAGAQMPQRTLTLAADGTGFSGTVTGQVIDLSGTVLQPICGGETAARIN